MTFDGVGALTCGDVLLVIWNAAARVPRVAWVFDRVDALARQQPGGVAVLQLVLPSSNPPDGPARALNQTRLRTLGPALRRLVTVPLGDAMWLSVVRTVMRGMAMLSGQNKVQLVADGERQGLDLLLESAGPNTPSRTELAVGVDALYRALGVARTGAASPPR